MTKPLFVPLVVLLAFTSPTPLCTAAELGAATQPAFTNHLAGQRSPYLLQHAHNPVDWYPWGAEAFEKAKRENKPIFLSIGYSTCHWCHVMERESFENEQVAKLINDHFVAIKVDREERPDLDAVYMQFVTAISGDGGWPMTVFLTPDLKPFFGGTYFPPDERDGLPGLKTILARVHEAWVDKHDTVVNSANDLAAKLKQIAAKTRPGQLRPEVFGEAFEAFRAEFDVHHGGFGRAPKFPRPAVLDFLFHYYNRTGDPAARDMALQTLRAMAAGGIHDPLGGGFHRYSTDERWFLPHFEKMLYDQAQLASSYLDAYQITRDIEFAQTARDTLDYVLRDMTGDAGQFFCAQDADSATDPAHPDRKAEGAFYVWTTDPIRSALGDEPAALFDFAYGVRDGGNVDRDPRGELKGKNVLFVAHTPAETAAQFGKSETEVRQALADARAKLLAARDRRPHPMRDDKALAAWNGLMISALARGGAVLGEPRYKRAATRAAEFVALHLYDANTHRLSRRWRDGHAEVPAFLEDYAFCIRGFLDLYEAGFDVRWLKLALELQRAQDELFWDAKGGGYFQAPADDASVIVRLKDEEDNALPAGNSVAALNLLRLSQMTDDRALRDRADQLFASFATRIEAAPSALPAMLAAFDFASAKPRQIVLAGRPDSPETRAMLDPVNARYLPNRILLLADGGAGQQFLAQRLPLLRSIAMIGGRTTAYVCENYACQLPTTDPAKLADLLDKTRTPATTHPSPD
jgi:hypothetical protein